MNTTETLNETDEKIAAAHDPSCRTRARVELAIVRELLTRLLAAGYEVKANNGEEEPTSGTIDEMMETLFAVDEAKILTLREGKRSFAFLVFGNSGPDVICDYGLSLEPIMDPLEEWILKTFGE